LTLSIPQLCQHLKNHPMLVCYQDEVGRLNVLVMLDLVNTTTLSTFEKSSHACLLPRWGWKIKQTWDSLSVWLSGQKQLANHWFFWLPLYYKVLSCDNFSRITTVTKHHNIIMSDYRLKKINYRYEI